MTISKIEELIRDLSSPLSLFSMPLAISEKGVCNPGRLDVHAERDKTHGKVLELAEKLKNILEDEKDVLRFMPIDCCFFARLVLSIETENRLNMDQNNPYSCTQTNAYNVLQHFCNQKGSFTLKSKTLNRQETFFLADFSNWHLDFLEYDNPLASLAFDYHTDLFNYCRLVPELNAWVNETSSKYQRIQRWASLPYICEYFYSGVILNLSEYYIDHFPVCIEKFKKIKFLILPPSLKEIPSSLKYLESLTIQSSELLSDEIIEEDLKTHEDAFDPTKETILPKGLTCFNNLTILALEELNLEELPEEIFDIAQLESLTCNYLSLEKLSASIKNLKHLTQLELKGNALQELPKEIFELDKLEFLDLSDNEVEDFYIQNGAFKKLISLNIQNNGIETFPLNCKHLTSLRHLTLSGNRIKEIPSSISSLSSLSRLALGYNLLTQLPGALSHLSSLRHLELEHNQLNSLPKAFYQLEDLHFLNLSHNCFTNSEIQVQLPPNLSSINLAHNKLSCFPMQLMNVELLTELNLSDNQIKTLPMEIEPLLILQKLDLSNNKIKEIPPSLGHLTALFHLNLSGNCIEKLPSSFLNLNRLTHFYLGIDKALANDHFHFLKKLDKQAQEAGGLGFYISNGPYYLSS